MKKYICTICGYVYDEEAGYPEANIPPDTLWDDIPSNFTCPLCGASENDFKELIKESSEPDNSSEIVDNIVLPDEISFSALELSAIFSNLAKGCEKQYDQEMADIYNELSSYYNLKTQLKDVNFNNLKASLEDDLNSYFTTANKISEKNYDRGSLRALKWAEQVTRMMKSHLNRISSDSIEIFEGMNIHVCEICGFIHIGTDKPEICPVCKVPNSKMIKIERVV